jgi:hypothetical protein
MNSPANPEPPSANPEAVVSVTSSSRKHYQKWWLLIIAAVAGCLLVYGLKDRVARAIKADEPEAYALLIVKQRDSQFPFDKQEKESDTDFDRYLHVQVVTIKDRFILNSALNKLNGTAKLSALKDGSDPLEWLEKNLEVSIEQFGIIRATSRPEGLLHHRADRVPRQLPALARQAVR